MTAWTVEYSREAAKQIAKLPKDVQRQLRAAILRYAESGVGNVIHLAGRPGEFRLRSGDYRVIFAREGDRLVILVLTVGHRRDVYRD